MTIQFYKQTVSSEVMLKTGMQLDFFKYNSKAYKKMLLHIAKQFGQILYYVESAEEELDDIFEDTYHSLETINQLVINVPVTQEEWSQTIYNSYLQEEKVFNILSM